MQILRRMIALAPMALLAGGAAFAQELPPPAPPPPMGTQRTVTTTTTTWTRPADALPQDQIMQNIAAAGYRNVEDLQFHNGVWVAKARDGAGDSMKILIAPVSGHVYAANEPSRLDKDAIESRLTAQGYQDVDDLDFDDGIWRAEARGPDGQDVDLLIDPTDGSVIASKQD
ncbi:MAG TPA: PepSY domain-containing protein [Rhodanobacteraceae bacterium]|nr:PepSY domain-containing protein [Rhodanobacteraceae bacterium]